MKRGTGLIDRRYAAAAAVLLVAAVALSVLASAYTTFPGDEWALARAQSLGDAFEPVADLFNDYDVPMTVVLAGVLAALLAWDGRAGAVLVALLAIGVFRPTLQLLKAIVDRPRPEGDFPVRDFVDDPSFPSGHVLTAVIAFGLWFLLAPEALPRRWVWPARVLALAGIVVMALSRMWAGVHWLSDTVGGVLWGGVALALAMALRPALDRLARAALRRARGAREGRTEA